MHLSSKLFSYEMAAEPCPGPSRVVITLYVSPNSLRGSVGPWLSLCPFAPFCYSFYCVVWGEKTAFEPKASHFNSG